MFPLWVNSVQMYSINIAYKNSKIEYKSIDLQSVKM